MARCARILPLLLALAVAGPSGAVPVEYGDRAAWDADVGGDIFLEGFEGIAGDPSFSSSPLDVGPFTIEQVGDPSQMGLGSTNLIDEAPFGLSGANDVNGSTYVLGFVDTSASTFETSVMIQMLFDTPVAAWGADFAAGGSPAGISFWLIPADNPSAWVPFSGLDIVSGFFGFVDFTGTRYSGVVIGVGSTVSGQIFGMDDVSGATIPEPSTAALLALGLVGLGALRRRC